MAGTNRQSLVLATMCLGTFMAILDTSLVNLGLHSIQADLRTDMATLQWVIDLYNLSYAVLILTGGTLGDLCGRRRIFILGVIIFAVGSLVRAVAPDAATLLAGRGMAGVGAALELPAALAILNVTYPEAAPRSRAIALWGGMNGLAMAIGPTVGGILVSSLGWRSLFYTVLPVAGGTVALATIGLEESAAPEGRHLDLPGQILAVITLGTLALGFIEGPGWGWSSPSVLGCFAACAMGFAAFILIEHHTSDPLLPLSIFRSAAFSAAFADATLMTFGMYGLLFLLPLYLQAIRGDSALQGGIALLPMSVTFFVVSPLAGRVATRVGPRALIGCGMGLNAVGLLLLASPLIQASPAPMVVALFALGFGLGFITGPIAMAAMANAPAARSGLSSGLVNVGRMVGATLGVAVLGLLFGAHVEGAAKDAPTFLAGMRGAFVVGAVAQVIGALIAVLCCRRHSLEGGTASVGDPGTVLCRRAQARRDQAAPVGSENP